MSLEEKVAFCSGADFWRTKSFEKYGISSIMMCDGPNGLRKQEGKLDHLGVYKSKPATCFPASCAIGSSWDINLAEEIGEAIGKEALLENISIVLAPGINIKRNPLCGRNFEYFSEDPYLSGKLGAAFIRGVQKYGVGTSLKHFAVNNQENKRLLCNSIVDERTLREIYLAGFEIAVKEGKPSTVMCAYNKINGAYGSENHWLLSEVLKDEWGFEG
ncbi:MAG: glycosyl hydrolase, partial [Oscillospiraceae bacterium]|nr:glycosyl hydrolase [Oscillospiraceae bacterium]